MKLSEFSLSNIIAAVALVFSALAVLIAYLAYRHTRKQDRLRLEKEEADRRNAIKPVFRIARQEPSVEELNFYDEFEKVPKPIDSIKYEGLVKNKYVDIILENITKQRPFNINLNIPKDLPFTDKPLAGATERDLIKNLVINTVIKDNLTVRDHINNFKLLLKFSDIDRNEYQQIITCKNYKLKITEPELLRKNNR